MPKKPSRLQIFFALLIFGGLAALLWTAKHPYEIYHEKPLPAITLTDLEGKRFTTNRWVGRHPVVINLMASWCGPCRAELPELRELGKHIPVYAIAWQDRAPILEAVLKKSGNPFKEVGLDEQGQLMYILGVNGIPTTLFLDSEGRLAHVREGAMTKGEVAAKWVPFVKTLR